MFGTPEDRRSKGCWRWKGGLELTLTGKYRGLYRDWRAARTYTPIGAIALALGMSYEDAARWAVLDYLRWIDLAAGNEATAARQRRDQAAAAAVGERQKRAVEEAAKEAATEVAKIAAVTALWRRAVPVKGTPAEAYLHERGIKAGEWPDTVRWHPAKRWLLVLSTSPEGDATALQAIHLTDDGKAVKRANGSKIKLTNGVLRGGAVRFAGKADGPVVICEGPETALAVWYATGFEAWAGLGSISGVSVEGIPHERIIVACPDDDARGAPTIQAANKAVRRWRSEGRRVLIATPYDTLRRDKSDHNDALRQYGREYVAARFAKVLNGVETKANAGTPLGKAREDLHRAINKSVEHLGLEAVQVSLGGMVLSSTSQIGIRVSVGGGKTKEAIEAMIASMLLLRKELGSATPSIVYAVPTHRLGEELIRRIEAEAAVQGINVKVRIWRGREAVEPETGEKMCLNIDAVEAAQKAMLRPQETVCQSQQGECPFFNACHYQEQRQATADIWLVPHASLFHERPKAIGQPALLIIDEGIWQASLRGFDRQKATVGFGSLQREPRMLRENVVGDAVLDVINAADLRETRHRLVRALRTLDAQTGEPLKVQALLDAGLTADMCRSAIALEWKRHTSGSLYPGMEGESFKRRAEELAEAQGDVRRLATMWQLLAEAIDSGQEASGRVSYEFVKDSSGSEHEALVLRWSVAISSGWEAPTLHVDATLRPELVRHLFPRLHMAAEIDIATPHQRTVAVVGKAFSHRALTEEKDVLKMWRAVCLQARLTPGETLVVLPQRAEDIIRAKETIPDHVHILHHNATQGLDNFGQVSRLIVVGHTLPPPATVSAMTAAITGEVVPEIGAAGGWYKVEMATVRAKDGSTVTLTRERHLDGLPDAIRASICEDQLIQAMGRGRGVNRTSDTPLDVEIWGDCEPPVEVDSFRQYQRMTKDAEAMAAGVWTESASDLSKLWQELGSEEAIKAERKRTGSDSNSIYYWKVTLSSDGDFPAHLRRGEYQRQATGAKSKKVVWDDRAHRDVLAFLSEKVGPIRKFEPVPLVTDCTPPPAVEALAGKTVFFCREGTGDTPLRLRNGRPLAIAPWEFEGCLRLPGDPTPTTGFMFRREGGNVSIYVNGDHP